MQDVMGAIKWKRSVLLASSFMLCVIYFILFGVEHVPAESDVGFIYLPADKTNISALFGQTQGNEDDGSCNLVDKYRNKRTEVDFRVIIVTYNRPHSLWRLLESLDDAFYDNDNVVFEIWLDRSKSHLVHNETLRAALDFKFSKGRCSVIVHPVHAGIVGQWLATWYPAPNSSEIAVILEDDLTVSPHFYRYLKLVHKKYRHRGDIYGFSLQGKSVRHSDGICCIEVPLDNNVFLYPTLGTSGFSPNNKNWIQFLAWYREVITKHISVPLITNHMSSLWYKDLAAEGRADSMWEMEYLYYTRKNKEYTLYPNFPDHQGLAFNWFEDGLHSTGFTIKDYELERKSLIQTWTLDVHLLPDNPVYLDDTGSIIR